MQHVGQLRKICFISTLKHWCFFLAKILRYAIIILALLCFTTRLNYYWFTLLFRVQWSISGLNTSRKFSNKITRCTYDLRARDLTWNYVGKNFRSHDKYQPKVRAPFIWRIHKNPTRHGRTITVCYLSSVTISLYFRYFSWHPRSSRVRDLPFVINYKIPSAHEERYMGETTYRFLKLAQWKSPAMNLGSVFMVYQQVPECIAVTINKTIISAIEREEEKKRERRNLICFDIIKIDEIPSLN